jgi:hypothetical protein
MTLLWAMNRTMGTASPSVTGEDAIMTDYPRFDSVKCAADVARRRYYYRGPFVDRIFWFADRWTETPTARGAPALDLAGGAVEIHERPPTKVSPSGAPEQALQRLSQEERFSPDFLMDSARTRRLQAGLLVVLAAILVALVGNA